MSMLFFRFGSSVWREFSLIAVYQRGPIVIYSKSLYGVFTTIIYYIIIIKSKTQFGGRFFSESISLFVSLSGSHRHNNYLRSISIELERPCTQYYNACLFVNHNNIHNDNHFLHRVRSKHGCIHILS